MILDDAASKIIKLKTNGKSQKYSQDELQKYNWQIKCISIITFKKYLWSILMQEIRIRELILAKIWVSIFTLCIYIEKCSNVAYCITIARPKIIKGIKITWIVISKYQRLSP